MCQVGESACPALSVSHRAVSLCLLPSRDVSSSGEGRRQETMEGQRSVVYNPALHSWCRLSGTCVTEAVERCQH